MPTQEHHRYTSSPSQTDPPRCFPCNSLNHTPRLCEPFHLEGRTAFLLLSSYKEADHDQLTTAWMKDLEDLTVAHRAHCDGLDLQHTAHTSTSLVARIEWCRRQEMQARTEAELKDGARKRKVSGTLFSREIVRASIGIVSPLCSSGMQWVSRTDKHCFAPHGWNTPLICSIMRTSSSSHQAAWILLRKCV